VSASGPTGQGPSADLKRSEALLREARAALRRLDILMSNAQAAQDPVTPLVAEARSNLERVVGQLVRRRSSDERRLRAAGSPVSWLPLTTFSAATDTSCPPFRPVTRIGAGS
jgi:hypothetical protein